MNMIYVAILIFLILLVSFVFLVNPSSNNETTDLITFYNSLSKKNSGKIIIGYHYSKGCGACTRMEPIWTSVNKDITSKNYLFVTNNEEKNSISDIDAYPTIIKYDNGDMSKYSGEFDADKLKKFILG